MDYPIVEKREATDTLHGVAVVDPYRWLEDEESDEVKGFVRAQDDLARGYLRKLPGREAIAARLKQLFCEEVRGVPECRGERLFFFRREKGSDLTSIWMEEKGEERCLVDASDLSEDGSVSLGCFRPSPDGRLVVYARRPDNQDEATLYLLQVDSGEESAIDIIPGARYAEPSFLPDSSGFLYTHVPECGTVPDSERPGRASIRFHRIGNDPRQDEEVFPPTGDSGTFLSADFSEDGSYTIVTVSHGWSSFDIYFKGKEETAFRPLVEGKPYQYDAKSAGEYFFVATTEGAPLGRICRVPCDRPSDWEEIVPERPGEPIQAFVLAGGMLVVEYLRDVSSRLLRFELDGNGLEEVALPDLGSVDSLVGRPGDSHAYFGYSSFLTPRKIYRVDPVGGTTELWFGSSLRIDADRFTTSFETFPSKDGTTVSMFVVQKRDLLRDESHPLVLTGYGGFRVALTPSFDAGRLAWLERGGILAVAHLRGGIEYGEAWHEAGMRAQKQHCFDDFIAAAEFLVSEGYTCPDRLAILGGSNGGLLVGAAMTQRPDLFRAVVCAVPLLDMMRYHLSKSGITWVQEYGSADDPEQFRWLHAYSPYHRVRPGERYPSLLLLSAESDDRVDPVHARKFAATMQAMSPETLTLLRTQRQAGHGGAASIAATCEEKADMLAFLCHELGLATG